MKLTDKERVLIVTVLALAFACTIAGCSYFNRYMGVEDDHFLEELVEEIIEYQTGVDIDLTPVSPE